MPPPSEPRARQPSNRFGGLLAVAAILLFLGAVGTLIFFGLQTGAEKRQETIARVDSLEDLIEAYLESQGGVETIESTNSLLTTGTYFKKSDGPPIPFSIIKKRPGSIRTFFDFPLMTQTRVYDGKQAIERLFSKETGRSQVAFLDGPQRESLIQNGIFDHTLVRAQEDLNLLRFLGTTRFRDRTLYRVQVLDGNPTQEMHIFVDPATLTDPYHLITDRATGDLQVIAFSNFRQIRGLNLPHMIEASRNGEFSWKMEISSIRINSGVSNSVFTFEEED